MAAWEVTVRVSLDLTLRVGAPDEAEACLAAERAVTAAPQPMTGLAAQLRRATKLEVRDVHAVDVKEWR